MAQRIANALLSLFGINLGIAFGAGLYESRIMFPQWLSASPESGYRWNATAVREANTYFIPTLLKLQNAGNLPESEAVAMASQWGRLNYVRHALSLTAWLVALKAFSLLSKRGG